MVDRPSVPPGWYQAGDHSRWWDGNAWGIPWSDYPYDRVAEYTSTPMIKSELLERLSEVRPNAKWPKKVKLADLIEFAVHDLDPASTDVREVRALELAYVIYRQERR